MKNLVILPTYNEKNNIAHIINDILNLEVSFQILVIDDDSPDNTAEIVEKLAAKDNRIHLIKRKNKRGLGSAYIEGFRFALQQHFDYIFQMDADFSHLPCYLPFFLDKIKNYDLVVGSRYVKGGKLIDWPLQRKFLSYFANLYVRLWTGLPLKDATSGFKCFHRKVLQNLNLDQIESDGYSFQIEVSYLCWKKGFKICEIPIIFKERRAGTSKMSRKIAKEASRMVWKLGVQRLFGNDDHHR